MSGHQSEGCSSLNGCNKGDYLQHCAGMAPDSRGACASFARPSRAPGHAPEALSLRTPEGHVSRRSAEMAKPVTLVARPALACMARPCKSVNSYPSGSQNDFSRKENAWNLTGSECMESDWNKNHFPAREGSGVATTRPFPGWEVIFVAHRQRAHTNSSSLRKVPDSGRVILALATAKNNPDCGGYKF